jgi:cephalosporin hydroxylase
MSEIEKFKNEVAENIKGLENDKDLQALSRIWIREISPHKYAYNFSWLGRPAIQFPQDQVALQELIWEIKPDLIIETGIAHGGSLVFSASMLALLDMGDAIESGKSFDPKTSKRKVLGLDIDIRDHNRKAIEAHPMSSRIQMIQGSSIDPNVVSEVHEISKSFKKILVCLDSNHTHEHVLGELEAYAQLTSLGSYCIVYDTAVEDMPADMFPGRPWGPGDNPKTAVWEYLKNHSEFEIDKDMQNKLMITVAQDGYLKRI